MIAHLRGIVFRKTSNQLVVDVSGVGYLVNVTADLLQGASISKEIQLETIQIFREDSVQLFGFIDVAEVEAFQMLCSVNGVGAKTALSVLNVLGVQGIRDAVIDADAEKFNSVSGIGPKTAKLIVLSLTGKLVADISGGQSQLLTNITAGLVNLGFQERLAKQAVLRTIEENPGATEEEILRMTLSSLSSARKSGSND